MNRAPGFGKAAKVMGSEVCDSSAHCRSLHKMPNGSGCDVVPPERAGSDESAKHEAGLYPGSLCPLIYRALDPTGIGSRFPLSEYPDMVRARAIGTAFSAI